MAEHQWVLYGTQGCHLCEQAQAVIAQLQVDFTIHLTKVDIAEGAQAAQLIQALGERIPVLENPHQQQTLDWPFDVEVLIGWLS